MFQSDTGGQQIQMKILDQLKKVTERLDKVEDRMTASEWQLTSELSTDNFLESVKSSKKSKKYCKLVDDSSSEESDTPTLDTLRSKKLQKKVDNVLGS